MSFLLTFKRVNVTNMLILSHHIIPKRHKFLRKTFLCPPLNAQTTHSANIPKTELQRVTRYADELGQSFLAVNMICSSNHVTATHLALSTVTVCIYSISFPRARVSSTLMERPDYPLNPPGFDH